MNNYEHCTLLQAGFGHHTSIFLKSYAHHCRHWMYYFLVASLFKIFGNWHFLLKTLKLWKFIDNWQHILLRFTITVYWINTNVILYNPVIWVYVWCMWFIIVVSTGTFRVILLGVGFGRQWSMNLLFEENTRLLFGSH